MAQVKFLKSIIDTAGWQEMEATDDLTLSSFSGSGSGLTGLNMDNAAFGILDKSFYDPSMVGEGITFLEGVLKVDYDETTIGIVGTKLAVIGGYATRAFKKINFITEDDILATSFEDTLNIVSGENISISTVAETNTITITASGGGNAYFETLSSNFLQVVSEVTSNLSPDTSTTRDLGDLTHRWRNVYIDSVIDVNSASVSTTRFQMIPTSGTSKPVASESVRGQVYITEGGPGVADVAEVCLKSSANTYSWVNLATG